MTTLDDIINEVHLDLLGFISDQEQITPLTSSPTSTDTSFTVSDGTAVSAGIIEVDEELMWCTDVSSNTVNVSVRGMFGTTAAAHTSGTSFVRNQPTFPRASIKRAINDTLNAAYPDIFGVDTTTVTFDGITATYALPADALDVLEVTWQVIGPSQVWLPLNRYRVDLNANTTAFANGKTITLMDAPQPGRTVQILYKKTLTPFAALTDDISTTGLAESAKETLVYGACARMVGYLQPSGMSNTAAEARLLENNSRMTSGATYMDVGGYYYQMYLRAKAEEARRLLERYPPRMRFTR